jgi:hypothetical protein
VAALAFLFSLLRSCRFHPAFKKIINPDDRVRRTCRTDSARCVVGPRNSFVCKKIGTQTQVRNKVARFPSLWGPTGSSVSNLSPSISSSIVVGGAARRGCRHQPRPAPKTVLHLIREHVPSLHIPHANRRDQTRLNMLHCFNQDESTAATHATKHEAHLSEIPGGEVSN